MARVGFIGVVQDTAGTAQSAVTVNVFQTGTTTNITETMFSGATGAGTLTNPLTTNSRGEFQFWLTNPKRVDLKVNTATPITRTVDLEPARDALNIFTGATDGDALLSTEVSGDTQKRLVVNAAGTMLWGSGSSGGDVSLSREGVSRLRVAGAFRANGMVWGVNEEGANYTIDPEDDNVLLVNLQAAVANATITLPAIDAGAPGKQFFIMRIDPDYDFNVIIDGAGGDLINGEATYTLWTRYQSVHLVDDGSEWKILNEKVTALRTETGNYTAVRTDEVILMNAAGAAGDLTVNLPTAVNIRGKRYIIKRIDNDYDFDVVVDPSGSQTIDGQTTWTLTTQYASIEIISDNANWVIV